MVKGGKKMVYKTKIGYEFSFWGDDSDVMGGDFLQSTGHFLYGDPFD